MRGGPRRRPLLENGSIFGRQTHSERRATGHGRTPSSGQRESVPSYTDVLIGRATSPPHQPAFASPAGPPGSPPAQVAHAGASSSTTFQFDIRRWSTTDRVTGIASLVVLIALFLPWFGISLDFGQFSGDSLSAHGYLYVPLFVLIIELLYLVAIAFSDEIKAHLPLPHERLLMIANGIVLLLVVVGFLDKPGGSGVGWRFGAFVALVGAVVALLPSLFIRGFAKVRQR
jgi:uncharacterized membrane protein